MMDNTLLVLRGISKSYSGQLANDCIDIDIARGEIHALLGENGAGKSTLVKIIYGILQANSGSIFWDGSQLAITNPAKARELGIGMVFQHFSLFEAMTIEENISLGLPNHLASKGLDERIVAVSENYGLPLDPSRLVSQLSVGEKQRVEIVRCLLQEPKLLIMDEPTSVLTSQEATNLFKTLRKLASEGCSILYISHRLSEIQELCHTATIMRLGRVVNSCDPAQESAQSLAEMMMGKNLQTPSRSDTTIGNTVFSISHLSSHLSSRSASSDAVMLNDISLEIREGEILGIAGLAGNGQIELLTALNGEELSVTGSIELDGQALTGLSPTKRRERGLHSAPEERLGHSAVADFSLWENTLLSAREGRQLVRYGFIRVAEAKQYATDIVDSYSVQTTGCNQLAGSLSGGNLQKFVMGRELLQNPRVCVALQPTWGVDAGSAATIHQSLLDLAHQGKAVLVISQDIDELFTICTHIAVMFEGELSPALPVAAITVESIGLLMGGEKSHAEQTIVTE